MIKKEDYISHYGVKGMKWGRRRGQHGNYYTTKDGKTYDTTKRTIDRLNSEKKKRDQAAAESITAQHASVELTKLSKLKAKGGISKATAIITPALFGTAAVLAAPGVAPVIAGGVVAGSFLGSVAGPKIGKMFKNSTESKYQKAHDNAMDAMDMWKDTRYELVDNLYDD